MKSIHVLFVTSLLVLAGAVHAEANADFAKTLHAFQDASVKTVLVAAHRGEHHHYPENSLPSIQAAIDLGIDIVEIDVRKTQDGQLVLMHDRTIDRTTNGKGKVSDLTWDELKQLRLKNPDGTLSDERIPTLKETMLLAKGKIMVNLDKSQGIFPECVQVLKETGTEHQAVLKGTGDPAETKTILDACDTKAFYMPIIIVRKPEKEAEGFKQYVTAAKTLSPNSMELVFNSNDTALLSTPAQAIAKAGDVRLWCNSLNGIGAGTPGQHEDKLAMTHPDETWGWLIAQGFSVIQTDEPELLLKYLQAKGLRH